MFTTEAVAEQATRLHSNGASFRSYKVNWPQGDGYEVIYASDHKEICSGTFKAGQRWSGSFLVKESTVKEKAPTTPRTPSIMVYNFDKGRVVGKKAFDIESLLLPKDSWLTTELMEALNESDIVILQ